MSEVKLGASIGMSDSPQTKAIFATADELPALWAPDTTGKARTCLVKGLEPIPMPCDAPAYRDTETGCRGNLQSLAGYLFFISHSVKPRRQEAVKQRKAHLEKAEQSHHLDEKRVPLQCTARSIEEQSRLLVS